MQVIITQDKDLLKNVWIIKIRCIKIVYYKHLKVKGVLRQLQLALHHHQDTKHLQKHLQIMQFSSGIFRLNARRHFMNVRWATERCFESELRCTIIFYTDTLPSVWAISIRRNWRCFRLVETVSRSSQQSVLVQSI